MDFTERQILEELLEIVSAVQQVQEESRMNDIGSASCPEAQEDAKSPRVQVEDTARECDSEPHEHVENMKAPSSRDYQKLKWQLDRVDNEWIRKFLQIGGLAVLFDSFKKICASSLDGVHCGLQLDCVACIKAVMDSRIGLDYIIENREYTEKLATGKYLYNLNFVINYISGN